MSVYRQQCAIRFEKPATTPTPSAMRQRWRWLRVQTPQPNLQNPLAANSPTLKHVMLPPASEGAAQGAREGCESQERQCLTQNPQTENRILVKTLSKQNTGTTKLTCFGVNIGCVSRCLLFCPFLVAYCSKVSWFHLSDPSARVVSLCDSEKCELPRKARQPKPQKLPKKLKNL